MLGKVYFSVLSHLFTVTTYSIISLYCKEVEQNHVQRRKYLVLDECLTLLRRTIFLGRGTLQCLGSDSCTERDTLQMLQQEGIPCIL